MNESQEYAFILNAITIAICFIVGALLNAMVKSLVNDIIMLPIRVLSGRFCFHKLLVVLKEGGIPGCYNTIDDARTYAVLTIHASSLISAINGLLPVPPALFMVVRYINRLRDVVISKDNQPKTKSGTFFLSTIPLKAARCAQCTSELISQ